MANWTIAPVQVDHLDEFVRCQFLAFVENPLHDVVYPTQLAAVETHWKAIAGAPSLQPGNEVVYLKAVDNSSGNIVGGIKFVIYAAEDLITSSPHAAGISDIEPQTSDEDQYRTYVLNELLGKRVRDLKGHHASKFIVKDS